MIKNLVKHGNSWAVVIDRPILDLLKIAPESQVELTTVLARRSHESSLRRREQSDGVEECQPTQ